MLAAKDQIFVRFGGPLAASAAFFLPLKLAPAYIFLIPFILLWLYADSERMRRIAHPLVLPLLIFILVALISAPFGISPSRSLPKFFNLFLFALAIPAYAAVIETRGWRFLIAPLAIGQSFAALNSVAEGAWPQIIGPWFLGKVTESGQLGLVLPMLGVIALSLLSKTDRTAHIKALAIGLAIFLTLTSLGLKLTAINPIYLSALFLLLIGITIASVRPYNPTNSENRITFILVAVILPLLASAFVINLKRGPWAGVFIAGVVYLMFSHRKLILPTVVAAILACILIEPIQTRLAASSEHFFIQGGRNMMWHIGAELASRYPLGIGYHNSAFLRNFALEIPPTHTHFHNNFINILVETGWLGLCCYLWWLARIFKSAFLSRESLNFPLALACGSALLAWQVAGIVEYNFGDSEVVQVAYLVVALLVSVTPASAFKFDFKPSGEPSYTAQV